MAKKYKPKKENKGSSSSQGHAHELGGNEGPVNTGGSWKSLKNNDWADGSKKTKDGCFPKLFVLALPFIAFGAYLFLRL